MKNAICITAATLALLIAGPAAAAPEDKAPTAQQTRMKDCNREAGDKQLKGEERKQFMSSCLSGKHGSGKPGPAAAAADHPECAAKAVDKNGKPLTGAARASFMQKCVGEAKGARTQ